MLDAEDIFDDDDYYTGPPLTEELVRGAEASLGVKLPASYIAVLRYRNGGQPKRRCVPTDFPTSWAGDHFEISGILGLGGPRGITAGSGRDSRYLIAEWGYPDVGVVICDTPSAGHDTVMLDYSESGTEGEPVVVYVDEDRIPRRVASSFADFIARLIDCNALVTGSAAGHDALDDIGAR